LWNLCGTSVVSSAARATGGMVGFPRDSARFPTMTTAWTRLDPLWSPLWHNLTIVGCPIPLNVAARCGPPHFRCTICPIPLPNSAKCGKFRCPIPLNVAARCGPPHFPLHNLAIMGCPYSAKWGEAGSHACVRSTHARVRAQYARPHVRTRAQLPHTCAAACGQPWAALDLLGPMRHIRYVASRGQPRDLR
jgi:hypothetical protein